jgi:sugar O-acyltransferase (sialic acid O-acetyltransferase NeuD family)
VRCVGLEDEPELNLDDSNTLYYLGVGNPQIRFQIAARFVSLRELFPSLIHPTSFVSESATIENGTYISAQTVISSKSQIGFGAFVNYGAKIGHDAFLDEFCVVAPNATVAGWCHIGTRVMIGANATLLPGIKVGKDAILGAGAVALRDVGQKTTVVGNPAVELKQI